MRHRPRDRATARELAASCLAADFHTWGPDAEPDPDNVGCIASLTFAAENGSLSIDLVSPRGGRRLLVNEQQLRSALAAAGLKWVRPVARLTLGR